MKTTNLKTKKSDSGNKNTKALDFWTYLIGKVWEYWRIENQGMIYLDEIAVLILILLYLFFGLGLYFMRSSICQRVV